MKNGKRLLLLLLAHPQLARAQFVEILSEIELISYRSKDTNAEANTKPRVISSVCVAGTNGWRIEDDWVQGGLNRWFYDGTNVYESLQVTRPMPQEMQERISRTSGLATVPFETARSNLTINIWPSPDGHPMGDEGIN